MFTGVDIRELRQKLGLTQGDMAKLLQSLHEGDQISKGPSPQTVRYWEQHPEKVIKEKHYPIIQAALQIVIKDQEKTNELLVKEDFITKVKSNLAKIPFLRDAVQMYFFTKDSKADLTAKLIAISALAYFILPFDAIPDFIPIVGYTDDAGVIAAALLKIRSEITEKHVQQAEEFLNGI